MHSFSSTLRLRHRPRSIFAGIALASALAATVLWMGSEALAANQITLSGTIAPNCTITVTADPNASTLNPAATGAQHVQVGTVVQSCNKKAGYTLAVTSANCAAAPVGAKITGTAAGETLAYSVESHNPTTGGSTATVTNLLATTCAGQNARGVTNSKISGETSTMFINYSGNAALSADAYQDVLTFTLNVS